MYTQVCEEPDACQHAYMHPMSVAAYMRSMSVVDSYVYVCLRTRALHTDLARVRGYSLENLGL